MVWVPGLVLGDAILMSTHNLHGRAHGELKKRIPYNCHKNRPTLWVLKSV